FEPFQLFVRLGPHEEFHLHLLKLAGAKNEIARSDFVAKRFAGLSDTEWQLDPLGIEHVGKVTENALRRLWPQIDCAGCIFDRSDESLEHQIELAGFGQLATAFRTPRPLDVVGAESLLAAFAVDQWIGEILQMAGSFPNPGMLQDCAVKAYDIATRLNHVAPPRFFDVALQFNAGGSLIPRLAQAPQGIPRQQKQGPAAAQVYPPFHQH